MCVKSLDNDQCNFDLNENKEGTFDVKNLVVNIAELKRKNIDSLLKTCIYLKIDIDVVNSTKNDLIFLIIRKSSVLEHVIISEGILDVINDSFGFLRYIDSNYVFSSEDIYVSQSQIKKFGLRIGDKVRCVVRIPKKGEKYISMQKILAVNDCEDEDFLRSLKYRSFFDYLTPIYPEKKFNFEDNISTRCIDLISPVGKGQRGLIVAPPRTGKTVLLQNIAHAIAKNHPEVYLIVLLIGERPEEVTDMMDSVQGEVIASTFDEVASRNVQISELVIERAKRMVEVKKDVMILLDSITRLARAYNIVAPSSGKILTGGIDSNALQKPKSFFGAARNLREGGSLTIMATALNDMGGSKMDEFIFEEFKGTGNMEIYLDRKVADKRLYPAMDPIRSGTRREELLFSKDTLNKHWVLRRLIAQMNPPEAMNFLLDKVRNSKSNEDFFNKMNG